jgi:triacylglycerol lipase
MQKPRAIPDLQFVFHPERDAGYVHFDGRQQAPFDPRARSLTRANAWWLAESALLSYWDRDTAVSRFAGAGLQAAFVEQGDTQAYVAWSDAFVIVAFRGTQPGSLRDIVDDALVALVPWSHGLVHAGFAGALERVWAPLTAVVEPLARSRSVWMTGHSLGAALATLAADRFPATAGVCTLGSPRVGDRVFAAGFDARFGERAARYVNDADIVTHVPTPFPLPYNHAGVLRQITPDGRITVQTALLPHFVREIFGDTRHLSEVSDALRAGVILTAPDFLLDHMPRAYSIDIWNDFDAHGPA